MEDPRSREELLRALADGRPIQWSREFEADLGPEESAFVRALHLIERVSLAEMELAFDDALPFRQWSNLRLERRLGEGSHGEVFLAHDLALDMDVALKLFKTQGQVAAERDALLDEARHLAKIRHPAVARVLGADIDHDRLGFWMELVPGRSLRQVVHEDGPLPRERVAVIGAAVAQGLAAIHAAGFVHQDIKPENVIETATGKIVLVDLGAARRVGDSLSRAVRGTPCYAAPEVLRGQAPSIASDAYSLGGLLHFLLTGEHPGAFESADSGEAIRSTRRRSWRSSSARPGASPLTEIVDRLLAPDAVDRSVDLERVASELDALARGRGLGHRGVLLVGLAVVLLAIVVGDQVRGPAHPPVHQGQSMLAFGEFTPRTPADSAAAQTLTEAVRARLHRQSAVIAVGSPVHDAYVRDPISAGAMFYGTVGPRRPLYVLSGEVSGASAPPATMRVTWRLDSWPVTGVRAEGERFGARIGDLGHTVVVGVLNSLGFTDSTQVSLMRDPALTDEAWIAYTRALRAFRSDRGPRTRALFERVLELEPHFAEAHYHVLFTLGADAAALQEHLQAAWRGRHSLSLKHRLLLEAQFAFARADLREMHRVQREVLMRWPDDMDALHAMIGVSLREGRAEEGLAFSERLLALDPDRHVTRSWYVTVVSNLRGARHGVEAAERFVRDQPSLDVSWSALGWALRRHGDREGAHRAFRRAFELASDRSAAREELALCALHAGNVGKALHELEFEFPGEQRVGISADLKRARILHEVGRTEHALAVLDSAFATTGISTLFIVQAMFLNEIQEHERARLTIAHAREVAARAGKLEFYADDVAFERGLARIGLDSLDAAEADLGLLREWSASFGRWYPTRLDAHSLAARLAEARGDPEGALASLDSIPLDQSAWVFLPLGAHRERELRWTVRLHEARGDLAKAAVVLDADLARTTHRPRIHFDRARVAWAMGDTTLALAHLAQAELRFARAEPGGRDLLAMRELADRIRAAVER